MRKPGPTGVAGTALAAVRDGLCGVRCHAPAERPFNGLEDLEVGHSVAVQDADERGVLQADVPFEGAVAPQPETLPLVAEVLREGEGVAGARRGVGFGLAVGPASDDVVAGTRLTPHTRLHAVLVGHAPTLVPVPDGSASSGQGYPLRGMLVRTWTKREQIRPRAVRPGTPGVPSAPAAVHAPTSPSAAGRRSSHARSAT